QLGDLGRDRGRHRGREHEGCGGLVMDGLVLDIDPPGPDWPDLPGGPWGGPFRAVWHALRTISTIIGTTILVLVAVALIALLVRYLWYATKAAQRYLELHPAPGAPASPGTGGPSAPAGGT